MQIVSVPLFNKDVVVDAYLFRYQKGNDLFSITQTTNIFDGAAQSLPLEMLHLVGLDVFSLGKPLFVPIKSIMLLGGLVSQCPQAPEKVIFLLEDEIKPEEPYLSAMARLVEKGYQFAISQLDPPESYDPILKLAKYYFIDQVPENRAAADRITQTIRSSYRNLTLIATSIANNQELQSLYSKGYTLFENQFNQTPVTQGEHHVSPLKANSIRLINTVQDENFDFSQVTEIVQRDTALTISLMKMVNAPSLGMRNKIKTISHAVAMLGQQEVRKWVTTAVSQTLGDDRPSEITRISLIRAKFAENLAPLFEMAHMAQGLFLMGLFSVLDIILEVPMEDALKMVLVSDVIRNALVSHSGLFYPVLNMITDYEGANWSAVSRHMIVYDIDEKDLSKAYIDALIWYKNLISIADEDVSENA